MTRATTEGRTETGDYTAAYYLGSHLGPPYSYEEPHWQQFFGAVADAVVATFAPSTSYDAGCAIGLLVRALVDRGVDARGGDISQYAVEQAPPGLRERLEVKDLAEPLDGRYDLVTCVEVLEHMSPADAQKAIAHLCAATDVILFSSTPEDFREATHVNVRTPASWAADFARHGFFRRMDVDASFLSPWAVVFAREQVTAVEAVHRYEDLVTPLRREVQEKRQALLETQREADRLRQLPDPERQQFEARIGALQAERDAALADRARAVADHDRLHEELVRLRGAGTPDQQLLRLTLVDELLGVKAELAQARMRADHAVDDASVELREYKRQLRAALQTITELRSSMTWRLGQAALTPVRAARRFRRP
jgi:hypothetical protein